MLTLQEAAERRNDLLFRTINPGAFGSLWFVPERIWKGLHKKHGYNQYSDRGGHPGCSIKRVDSTLGPVNLLHGTSRFSPKTVAIKDVLDDAKTTYFGGLPPVPVSLSSWQGGERERIQATPKGHLAAHEEVAIMTLCVKKGWL